MKTDNKILALLALVVMVLGPSKKALKAFLKDEDGIGIFQYIITVSIALIVLAALLPGALNTIFAVNTSAWDAGTVALWGVVALITVVGIVMKIWRGSTE